MHISRYNVFNAQGQLIIAPGDPIDQAEAERQGLIRPAPVEVAAVELPSPEVEVQALLQPSATAERKAANRGRSPERDHPGGRGF